jgi:hypothetical protein
MALANWKCEKKFCGHHGQLERALQPLAFVASPYVKTCEHVAQKICLHKSRVLYIFTVVVVIWKFVSGYQILLIITVFDLQNIPSSIMDLRRILYQQWRYPKCDDPHQAVSWWCEYALKISSLYHILLNHCWILHGFVYMRHAFVVYLGLLCSVINNSIEFYEESHVFCYM